MKQGSGLKKKGELAGIMSKWNIVRDKSAEIVHMDEMGAKANHHAKSHGVGDGHRNKHLLTFLSKTKTVADREKQRKLEEEVLKENEAKMILQVVRDRVIGVEGGGRDDRHELTEAGPAASRDR